MSIRSLFAILFVAALPLVAFGAAVAERGVVAGLTRCSPDAYALTLSGTTTPFIYAGAPPAVGERVVAIVNGTATCGSTMGRRATHILRAVAATTPTNPSQGSPSSSGASGNGTLGSFLNPIRSLLGRITSSLNPTPATPTTPGGSLSSGLAQGFIGGILSTPFGGPIIQIQMCETPVGGKLVTLGPPTAGLYLYKPGYSVSFVNGPPSFVGQNLVGTVDGPEPCDVCFGNAYCPIPGKVINNRPGHGSSGGKAAAPPTSEPPAPQKDCTSTSVPRTASEKRVAEEAMRKELGACNVSVNKAACSFGTSGDCTDVSGLQCGTSKSLCDIAKECGPLTLTGGSEGGHAGGVYSHGRGYKFDLGLRSNPEIASCVQKITTPAPFTQHGPTRIDKFGNVWVFEGGSQPHWDICVGAGCR